LFAVFTGGALGLPGLWLMDLGAAHAMAVERANRGLFTRAKRCVRLFLTGAVPQHDSWDPKPELPANVRGEFSPIPTIVRKSRHWSWPVPKFVREQPSTHQIACAQTPPTEGSCPLI